MDLGIAIVSWNVCELLAACLTAAFADVDRARMEAGVWVVDNASGDGSADMVRERFPKARLIANDHNAGFAAANNQALRAMGFSPTADDTRPTAAVLFLNPDSIVKPGALKALVDFMHATRDAGVAGANLLNADGSPQECAFDFPGFWQALFDLFPPRGRLGRLAQSRLNGRYPRRFFERVEPFRIGHPLGAAFLVRSEAIAQVGLMDEAYHMYCEEIDWVWRMRRVGWAAYCVPQAQVIHHGGQSTSQIRAESLVNLWRSRKRLYDTYRSPLTTRLVGRLVHIAMKRRARRSGEARQGLHSEIARIWARSRNW